jgi:hypothetical protein
MVHKISMGTIILVRVLVVFIIQFGFGFSISLIKQARVYVKKSTLDMRTRIIIKVKFLENSVSCNRHNLGKNPGRGGNPPNAINMINRMASIEFCSLLLKLRDFL